MTMKRWSIEQANEWYERIPWIVGCNFIPSRCINNIEIWQEFDFEDVLRTGSAELKLAAEIGINSIRMVMPFQVWKHQREGFLNRLDRFLDEASKHGISLMPVLFDDCCGPKPRTSTPRFGTQPAPVPGHHGGTVHTPFDGGSTVGYNLSDEQENWSELERYVEDLVGHFSQDERILIWDIWNEPGNSNRDGMSLPFMTRVFEVARAQNPIQPLTAGPWNFGDEFMKPYGGIGALSEIEKASFEQSDVITYHYYGPLEQSERLIQELQELNRPLLITEWLHRPFQNEVAEMLPLYQQYNVGCYHWGLVAGKTQTYEPWDAIRSIPNLDLMKWQHDLFRENLSAYDDEEIAIFKRMTDHQNIRKTI
jgi:hypothetical protein